MAPTDGRVAKPKQRWDCHRGTLYGRRAFAVAGLTVWNSLPEDMRDPEVSEDSYRQSLKKFLFVQY